MTFLLIDLSGFIYHRYFALVQWMKLNDNDNDIDFKKKYACFFETHLVRLKTMYECKSLIKLSVLFCSVEKFGNSNSQSIQHRHGTVFDKNLAMAPSNQVENLNISNIISNEWHWLLSINHKPA